MADQIVLAWTVDVAGSSFGTVAAQTALAAVSLYDNARTDPVLGALFGLTVDSDVMSVMGTTVTRTLTLNMNAANAPEAPPPFPCHPDTSTPPVLPYVLRRASPLGGSFFVTTGSMVVPTTGSQLPALEIGDSIQFLSQPGVFYELAAVAEASITLTAAFSGKTTETGAFELVSAPVTLAAVYSSSDLDTDGESDTTPAIAAGPGAREIEITYTDSSGAGPFTVAVKLTGRRPAAVVLDVGSDDIAEITNVTVSDAGSFENSVGQITIVELSSALPALPLDPTADDYNGRLTDEAQLLIGRTIAYLPPSYFALAQQGMSMPQLEGDFLVTTGSVNVETTEDQTGVLSPGDIIRFAAQLTDNTPLQTRMVLYTIDTVSEKSIRLTTPYTGIDDNFTGSGGVGAGVNAGTKGNIGAKVMRKLTGAFPMDQTFAAPPINELLKSPLGRFVQTANVGPNMESLPAPTVLSDLFTHTLRLALAVPITAQPITFI